jgi:hypothetical protein
MAAVHLQMRICISYGETCPSLPLGPHTLVLNAEMLACSMVTWYALRDYIRMMHPDHYFAILDGLPEPGSAAADAEGFTLVGGSSSSDPLRVWLEGNLQMDWLAGRILSLPPPSYDAWMQDEGGELPLATLLPNVPVACQLAVRAAIV